MCSTAGEKQVEIYRLQAENSALTSSIEQWKCNSRENKLIAEQQAAENAALKEQVAQLERTRITWEEHDGLNESDIRATVKHFEETIAQQAEAIRVKDTLLSKIAQQTPEKPDYWSSCSQCQWNSSEAEDALAIQPNPDILRERDARLVERIAEVNGFERSLASVEAYDPQSFIDGAKWTESRLHTIADQIRKGEWKP